jgi:hypothetical protein
MFLPDALALHDAKLLPINSKEFAISMLAACIYFITYSYNISKSKRSEFCWEVCGDEINAIKKKAVTARSSTGESLVLLSRADLKYITSKQKI